MSRCIDKKFEKLLSAYELGMLDEKDKDAFELHLYECEYCFKKATEFEKAAGYIQRNPAVKDSIRQIAESAMEAAKEDHSLWHSVVSRRVWPKLVPAAAVVIIVLIFLILRPWQIEFRTQQDAWASANRLAIVDFRNLSDPQDTSRLGLILSNLLTTDLSESQSAKVVSNERINDVLKLIGKTQDDMANRETATNMAKRVGARWILYGSFIDKDDKLTVTTQLTEARSGEVLKGRRMTAEANEDIFALVDKLALQIKKDLSFPAEVPFEPVRSISEITTRSPEAYRLYLEGVENYQKRYYSDAKECFNKALSFDTSIAMAYYYMAKMGDQKMIFKAKHFAKNATTLQRHYIESSVLLAQGKRDTAIALLEQIARDYPDEKNAYLALGGLEYQNVRYDSAIANFNEAIKIDSLFKNPYNELAYAYQAIGNVEKALESINKYIELSPDEANPYDTQGELYATNGMPDKAIESYRQALRIKPDFMTSFLAVGYLHLLTRDYDRADSCYRHLESIGDGYNRAMGRVYRALIPYNQGKISAALKFLDSCLVLNKSEKIKGITQQILYMKSFIYQGNNDFTRALATYYEALNTEQKETPEKLQMNVDIFTQLLAQNGRLDSARNYAEQVNEFQKKSGFAQYSYWYGTAAIAFAEGDIQTCIKDLEKIGDNYGKRYFIAHYLLGRAYLVAGDFAGAIREFENQINVYNYSHARHAIWNADMHYYLGVAYEESKQVDKAIKQYQLFLDIFRNADPEVMSRYDAARRLGRLLKSR
ncbi:MAG: FlgO family outer membrane protein [candidate division Zixibacteria bacterium]|nr:FlgO family outer membrane protein [candidate division Zixibacteria bacterium]